MTKIWNESEEARWRKKTPGVIEGIGGQGDWPLASGGAGDGGCESRGRDEVISERQGR